VTDPAAVAARPSRPLSALRTRTAVLVAVAAALFHLYAAGVTPFTALVQRPAHLAFMIALGFLGLGVRARPGRFDAAWLIAGAAACLYFVAQHEPLMRRTGAALPLDLAMGAIVLVVVLELARRAAGPALVVVALLALGYSWAGPWLPGALAHRGYSPVRVIEHLTLSTEGVFGVPLGVSADFVYLFVLFGALLEVAGGGTLLVALAARAAGGARGAPALTATVASAFMGSLSGSAVANVVTTGSLTIPIMRRAGFRPTFAGAVEAAASTGGQLMPPIMGAGAFILASWTGIPYAQVALAAAVPAVLYYGALLAAVHFRAVQAGLPGGEALAREPVLPRLHLLLPVVVIVLFLAIGRSPMRAAFWGVATAAAAALLVRSTRPDRQGLLRVVLAAGSSTVQVAAACATAGIVVGVASLTGIGLRMSELILTLSQGYLPAALVLTAAGSLVLGMGLPTTAAYVVLAALGAPALVDLGVPLLAAHLFLFYFGCMSNVTPPVALAAFAAAGIAGGPPMRTAATAMGLAAAGFLVPFLFVYGPALLLEGSPAAVGFAILTAFAGVVGLAAAVIGHVRAPISPWRRVLAAAAAVALIAPETLTDAAGLVVLAAALYVRRGTRGAAPAPPS
jgi:TRAP transporter 4TM/12TM fusion protein